MDAVLGIDQQHTSGPLSLIFALASLEQFLIVHCSAESAGQWHAIR